MGNPLCVWGERPILIKTPHKILRVGATPPVADSLGRKCGVKVTMIPSNQGDRKP